jgi:hypothetical protein
MSFTTTNPGNEKLVITLATPGEVVKSAYELLELGPPGQPDKLTLYYDALVESTAGLNAAVLTLNSQGTDVSAVAVTAGTWIAGAVSILSRPEELPFARFAVPCLGLAESKPNAVRWFAVTETQSGEDILYLSTLWPKLQAESNNLGVEIDTVLLGSSPDMAQVSTNVTPPSAPTPAASVWATLANPTRQYPDGWVLVDTRSQQINGSATAWLVTYVYRYKYPYTP